MIFYLTDVSKKITIIFSSKDLTLLHPWASTKRKHLQLEVKAGFYHGIYRQHRASQPAAATKHRNELLVDAESFAYIFASPNGEHQQDPLAKVKTAMLLIQKDSEARGYAPFIMRPSPLFTHGYFLLNSADAAAVNCICTGAAALQDEAAGVYDVDLARLWSSRWQNDFSFPQFKYLLYTHSDKLPLNAQLHLTPAMQLTLEWHANADARFSVLLRALKEIFFEAARSGQYLYDRDAAARLAQATGLSSTRGTTQEGAEYSVVDPFISEFFHWLEQSFAALHSGETCRYLPVNDSVQGSERLTPALGVLEELDLLHFALLGGSNSRLYLYVNQTQTLELADRGFYRNHLLERIAQRHTDAVRLMSWLFTSGFSSEQLWDRIEEYFLGLPIQGFDAPSAESR